MAFLWKSLTKEQINDIIRNYISGREDSGIESLSEELVKYVIKRHFLFYSFEYQKDMFQVGIEKFLRSALNYDFERSAFTFFYTVVRNEIHNFLYHNYHKNLKHDYIKTFDDDDDETGQLVNNVDVSSDIIHDISLSRFISKHKFVDSDNKCFDDFLCFLHEMDFSFRRSFLLPDDFKSFAVFASLYSLNPSFIYVQMFYSAFSQKFHLEQLLFIFSVYKIKLPNNVVLRRIIELFHLVKKFRDRIKDPSFKNLKLTRLNKHFLSLYNKPLNEILSYIFFKDTVDLSFFFKRYSSGRRGLLDETVSENKIVSRG